MEELRKLNTLLQKYRSRILLAMGFLVSLTAVNMIVPYIIRQVIDVGLAQAESSFMLRAALVILIIGVLRAVLPFGVRYTSEWIAAQVGFDLRNRLYNHIQYLPFRYHDHAQAGQLISRCIEDARAVERFTGFSVVELIQVAMLTVGITTLIFLNNALLSLLALLPMLPLLAITLTFGKKVSEIFFTVDRALGELSSRLQENVSGAQVVRAFAREDHEIERFDESNRKLYGAQVQVISEFARVMPTTNLLVTLSTIIILWFGGRMVLNGEISIGELVAFNSYVMLLAAPVQQLAWLVNSAGEAVAGVRRAFEVLDTAPEIRTPPDAVQLPALTGRVEYRNVSFSYASDTARALKDINLVVEPNQVVALIGPTGSGKSSFIHLIPRFYDVSEGSILVDGHDVRTVDLKSLRQQIGLVLQTSLLFSTTIKENIAYGRPEASMEEVIAAAKSAQAHEFIMGLQQGYDTVVGERGITLSGGQRQRVAIARALLLDPRILILDDSTSSVDTQTERLIQLALDHLMEGRTTFVIAHRLSTVRRADLIIVLDHGEIVERGTHQALIQHEGLYRQIYELQLRDQEAFREEIEAQPGRKRRVLIQPRESRTLET
jgi:ABC-type multidrug transport system fused ATPase/permease subunit